MGNTQLSISEALPPNDVVFNHILPLFNAAALYNLAFMTPESHDIIEKWWNNDFNGEPHISFNSTFDDFERAFRLFWPFRDEIDDVAVDPCLWTHNMPRPMNCENGYIVEIDFDVEPEHYSILVIGTDTLPQRVRTLSMSYQFIELYDLREHRHLKEMCVFTFANCDV